MSYCGLLCNECGAYRATVNDNNELRAQIAEEWGRMYDAGIKPGDINCLGCRSGVNFGYCGMCQVRACNLERQLNNCAECDSYTCDNLEEILKHAPEIRARLDRLRA